MTKYLFILLCICITLLVLDRMVQFPVAAHSSHRQPKVLPSVVVGALMGAGWWRGVCWCKATLLSLRQGFTEFSAMRAFEVGAVDLLLAAGITLVGGMVLAGWVRWFVGGVTVLAGEVGCGMVASSQRLAYWGMNKWRMSKAPQDDVKGA